MPIMPSGTEIASYRTYAGIQAAVNFLPDEELDVKSITIVDTDLHLVERVAGRLIMTKAVLPGMSSDALWGTFVGLMMSFASTSQSALLQVPFGIVGDMLAGTFMSGFLCVTMGGHRDLASQPQVIASRYVVLASAGVDQAFKLLQRNPDNQMRPRSACRWPEPKGPSEYGSRPDEKPHFGVRLSDEGEDDGAEVPRNNEHAAPAQEPVETAVESVEGFRKPLD